MVRVSYRNDMVGLCSITDAAARLPDAAVRSGIKEMASGGTEAGKTTLLSGLAVAIPPRQRVVTWVEVSHLTNPEFTSEVVRSDFSPAVVVVASAPR